MSATGFQRRRRELAAKAEQPKAPSVPSREEIADMKRAEVKEWLAAHGVDDAKGNLAELRATLTKTLYTDL